ncbi:MAG: hypothetical protein H7840_17300 [Alphaproteobacteria bacterium]
MPLARIGFEQVAARLGHAIAALAAERSGRFERAAPRLRAEPLLRDIDRSRRELSGLARRLRAAAVRALADHAERTERAARLLASCSYESVLGRGFAVVWGADGHVVDQAEGSSDGATWSVEFQDGRVGVVVNGDSSSGPARTRRKVKVGPGRQGDLF